MNIVKICSIIGFFFGVIYAGMVALPDRLPGQKASMFVPQMLVPQEPGVAPGTQPPVGTRIKTLLVLAVFMGPFGALAGLGVGLLLDGAVRTIRGKPGVGNRVTGQKEK